MNDEPTTVAWTAIEPHWQVVASDGEEVGEIFATVGDREADIFNGLAVTRRGGPAVLHELVDKPKYVPSEQVAAIQPGVVHLSITSDEAEELPEHEPQQTLRILPDEAGATDRTRTRADHEVGDDES